MIVLPHGQRVTVMGLGRFGGGTGVTRWLADNGARVTVTDLQSRSTLAGPLREIAPYVDDGRVCLHLGGHLESDFVECDRVVVTPAVPQPWDNPFLRAARMASVPLTTEIGLVTERIDRGRVIGVTGTAGKSTTAAMIHHIFEGLGHRAHLGGNIGGSLLNRLGEIEPDDWIVLELSSAMLWWLAPWSARVAVMTNLRPNHLDWHGSMRHYRQCKEAIFRNQRRGDIALREADARGDEPIRLAVPGEHNQANARLAIATTVRIGLDGAAAADTLGDFRGLPDRLQLVAEHEGRRFYNDSKATTPEATRVAVAAFENPTAVHLLAGGYDKQVDLAAIVELAPKLAGFYTMGATGRSLAEAVRGGHAEYCETVDNAVTRARARMKTGDVLLLSPGCASWDQFENYRQRGAAFRESVEKGAKRGVARSTER